MINKVILLGNVGAEPEYRVLDGGAKMATFRLATTERFKKEDGTYNDTTEWHTIVAWKNLADIVDKHIHKGDRLYVEGSIHYRTYTDKENIERKITTITAKEIKMLSAPSGKSEAPQQVAPAPQPTTQVQPPLPPISHPDDDLPW